MSIQTLSPAADDFSDFEFAAMVADFNNPLAGLTPATQPHGEPLPQPDETLRRRERRAARRAADQAAIDESWRKWR